jgi:hypothetical protein
MHATSAIGTTASRNVTNVPPESGVAETAAVAQDAFTQSVLPVIVVVDIKYSKLVLNIITHDSHF